jgi:hypothetical protein
MDNFVMKDNAFKGMNAPGKKPMAKFNTAEFQQYDLTNSKQKVFQTK